MGSAALNQPGSLILGGYEQNQSLGSVKAFPFESDRGPKGFLLDVTLAVQTGGSPLLTDVGSVYQGLRDNELAAEITRDEGGKLGSAVVKPNPAAPYIPSSRYLRSRRRPSTRDME